MDAPFSLPEAGLRLVVALFLGAMIGWEREARGRPAGLRTHMMVSLGSAAFTLAGLALLGDYARGEEVGGVRADPLRVLSGIVGGVGFLGAGAIIQAGGQVRGMTTAAGLWVVAAVGLAVGSGLYAIAAIVTVLSLATLLLMRTLEERVFESGDDDDAEGEGDAAGAGADHRARGRASRDPVGASAPKE